MNNKIKHDLFLMEHLMRRAYNDISIACSALKKRENDSRYLVSLGFLNKALTNGLQAKMFHHEREVIQDAVFYDFFYKFEDVEYHLNKIIRDEIEDISEIEELLKVLRENIDEVNSRIGKIVDNL